MSDTPRQRRDAADQAFQDSLEQLRSAFEGPSRASKAKAQPEQPDSEAPAADIDQSLESAVADIEEFFRSPAAESDGPVPDPPD